MYISIQKNPAGASGRGKSRTLFFVRMAPSRPRLLTGGEALDRQGRLHPPSLLWPGCPEPSRTQNRRTDAPKLTMPFRRSAQIGDSGVPEVSKTFLFTKENDKFRKRAEFGFDATLARHFCQFDGLWDVSDSPFSVLLALLSLPRALKGRFHLATWCLKGVKKEPTTQNRRTSAPKLTMPPRWRPKATILGRPELPKPCFFQGKTTIFEAC